MQRQQTISWSRDYGKFWKLAWGLNFMGPYFYGSNHSSYGISIAPILFIKICKIIFSFLHNYHPKVYKSLQLYRD